jgi:hypothetical protein
VELSSEITSPLRDERRFYAQKEGEGEQGLKDAI